MSKQRKKPHRLFTPVSIIILVILYAFFMVLYFNQRIIFNRDYVQAYAYNQTEEAEGKYSAYITQFYYQYNNHYYFGQQPYYAASKQFAGDTLQVRIHKKEPVRYHIVEHRYEHEGEAPSTAPLVAAQTINAEQVTTWHPKNASQVSLSTGPELVYPKSLASNKLKSLQACLERMHFVNKQGPVSYVLSDASEQWKLLLIYPEITPTVRHSLVFSTIQQCLSQWHNPPLQVGAISQQQPGTFHEAPTNN